MPSVALAANTALSNAPPVKKGFPQKPEKIPGKPEKVVDKPVVDKPVVDKPKPAPLTEEASERFDQTRAELDQRQAAAATNLNGGTDAGCNGLLCLGSLTNAAQAAATAATIASYAASMHNQALERRTEIIRQINYGAQSGAYPVQSVQQLHEMFKANSLPPDKDIQRLHENIQDGATALRINQEERDVLTETHETYTRAANAARGMHKTLQGYMDRGTTLAPGGVPGGKGNAAYPTGVKGGAVLKVGSSGKNQSDVTSRSEEQLETGRAQGIEAGLGGGTGGGSDSLTAFGKNDAKKADEKRDGKGSPSQAEGKLAGGPAEGEGKKVLSSEAKTLLAGMMMELKADIAKGIGSGDKKDIVVTDANGVRLKINDVPAGSALEGMLMTMSPKEAGRAPSSGGPAAFFTAGGMPAPGQQLSNLDFLGIDKSLFARVKDYLRSRGQRDSSFAGR